MPKAIKKRITKKTSTTEEEVQDKLSGLKVTMRERRKTVFQYGAIVLIVILAAASFFIYTSYAQKKSQELSYEGYKTFYNIPKTPMSKEEQYQKALDMFQKSYNTKKSPVSLFYIAACYYELGRYDDALKSLKDFTGQYSSDAQFIPLAYQKMSTIYVKKGDMKEAKKTLDTLYNFKGDIYKDFALIEYARLLEKEGKGDEAKKKYEELSTKYPNSPFIDEAKTKLSVTSEKKKEG
jgi:predicted negative regulator of RcsB-dependent stress response